MNFGGGDSSDFTDDGFSANAGSGDSAEVAMARIQQQLQSEMLEGLVQSMVDKGFEQCVKKPSTSLSSSERTCLARCQDRYMECMALVFKSLERQAQKGGGGMQ